MTARGRAGRRPAGLWPLAAAAMAAAVGCAGTRSPSEPAPFSTSFAAWLAWDADGSPLFDIAVALPADALLALVGSDDTLVRLVLQAEVTPPGGASRARAWTRHIATAALGGGDVQWCVALGTESGPQQLALTVLVQGRPWGAPWRRRFEVPPLGHEALILGEPVFLTRLPAASADSACNDIRVGRYFDAETGPPHVRVVVYDFAAAVPETAWTLSYVVHAREAADPAVTPPEAVASGRRHVSRRGPLTPVEFDLPALPLGVHDLELSLQGDGRSSGTSGLFEVGLVDLAALGAGGGSMELLALLLSPAAADSLRRAAPQAREALWDDLWRQPDREATSHHEGRDAALGRVREANRRFGTSVPGWRTDRGRVYIAHGAPDVVDTLPNPQGFERLERWTYAAANRVFVFVDRDGTGDYTLLRTNAPGD